MKHFLGRCVEHALAFVVIVAALAALFSIGSILAVAWGHPPDAPNASWYNSLHNKAGGLCCGPSDCAPTEFRPGPKGYQVLAPDGSWVDVPPEAVVEINDNPEGRAVACFVPMYDEATKATTYYVRCFVKGTEA